MGDRRAPETRRGREPVQAVRRPDLVDPLEDETLERLLARDAGLSVATGRRAEWQDEAISQSKGAI